MHDIDRRKFLRTGTFGVGAGLLSPVVANTQSGGGLGGAAMAAATRVSMMGDGLGLTPAEQGHLLIRLADEGRVVRDSYSNGGTVEELEERFAEVLGKERAVFMPTGTLANHLAVRALADGPGRSVDSESKPRPPSIS